MFGIARYSLLKKIKNITLVFLSVKDEVEDSDSFPSSSSDIQATPKRPAKQTLPSIVISNFNVIK